mgnify:CR=1 FL=1
MGAKSYLFFKLPDQKSVAKHRRSPSTIVMETESNEIVLSADFNPRHMRLYSWNLVNVDKAQLKWYEFDYSGI